MSTPQDTGLPASASTGPLWRQLRTRHPRFVYESFSLEPRNDGLRLRFHFRIEPDIEFAPETTIERTDWKSVPRKALENLAFHLGLVEMLSYWKAACSPEIVIKAGALDAEQAAWWGDLLRHGMGEYFYVNRIDCRATDFVRIVGGGEEKQIPRFARDDSKEAIAGLKDKDLVLASGGKDSVVTLEVLREARREFDCLMLNPTEAALAVARQAGCASPLVIRRTIDERLLELNRRGYLNGHTPFSALLAMLGVTVAALGAYRNVIVANERSAEEASVEYLGKPVNHQYSKTYRYETKFREYCQRYLVPYEKQVLRFAQDDSGGGKTGIEYFSLLRPLYELQIARRFAEYPQYFGLFKSCNRGMATNSWCGRCPKCLFVYTALYPFVERERMLGIFGADLFAGEGVAEVLLALLGLDVHKPFECVGTKEETIAAIHLCIEKYRKQGVELPPALRAIEESVLSKQKDLPEAARRVLTAWSDQHYLPPELAQLLQHRPIHW